VSMGTIAARKSRDIMENARKVLSMELLAACQGVDLRGNKGLGKGTKIAYNIIRNNINYLKEDRPMYFDINKCENILATGEIVKETELEVGELL
ncbi:MAG: aromatic amino acid lyase, partial [Tissierellaceae bacterium]